LQRDVLVDLPDGALLRRGCALRVRAENGAAVLTFKGPVVPGPFKVREEIETPVDHADRLLGILHALGYRPAFTYEKYREEFVVPGAVVAIDETPIGTFVEIEGEAQAIQDCATRLGKSADDYVTASYRSLHVAATPSGQVPGDMTFPRDAS
jgi:adenylate cyclase, class 2